MKYFTLETVCALVTSLLISLLMHYLNRDNKDGITLKTHFKTFILNSLVIVILLYLKKKVLDSRFSDTTISIEPLVETLPSEYTDIIVGTPNF